MSVLIKGMEMPIDGCSNCIFVNRKWHGDFCPFLKREVTGNVERGGFQTDCPLVPVPPHGRLIDADAFLAEQRHLYCENCAKRKGMKNGKMKFVYDIGDAPCRSCGYGDVLDDIDDAPTIIPASGG